MVAQLLERFGVIYRWRAAMAVDPRQVTLEPALPPGYRLLPWDAARLAEVAEADYHAYRGSLDARLYWRYFSTREGCKRMWREAMAGRFGRFDTERTLLLERDGMICGALMASMRTPAEGFIGNLAVAPPHRGGTGTALLLTCLHRYRKSGVPRVSLAVTLENERAYRLYTRVGFTETGRFPILSRPTSSLLTHPA